ncbi:HlyD family type I secretion periplasmic adaptor subunit [Achromobacter xylosoxidans]|uniref:HlyD family type I secretion periplasmic adaptor subunit n=1 Tax=Achromobacter anxifer TaxID=1287737 RepID=UPI001590ED5D|nr:HlyD family type I secretion periplasmic adaptor subunit [Achromobacter anxifer]
MSDSFLRAHRSLLWALSSLFVAFIVWICLAKLDIVMVSEGKLIPEGFVQVLQAPADSRVVRILVQDGDRVVAGDPVVELDTVDTAEDSAAARAEVVSLRNRLARADAELAGRPPQVSDPQVLAEYTQRTALHAAQVAEVQRQRDQAVAELQTATSRRAKYASLLPVAQRQADMLEKLKAEGFVSESALNEKLIPAIETGRELEVQVRAELSAQAQVRAVEASLARVHADYRRQLAVEKTETELRLRQAEAVLAKLVHRAGLQMIKAPVAGQVTGIKVQTLGQVTPAGASLLSVVPEGQRLRFEGWLRNEDSAFVAPGMSAKVKLSAYPFQKYGWLEGTVSWIGVDSETPESMRNAQGEPLFYRVRVDLDAQALTFEGAPLTLRAGMQAAGDIQIGRRTIFEYLTSPMRKVTLEAARER